MYPTHETQAGAATTPDGLLLVLAPLPGTHEFMRCVVVKAATTAEGDGVVAVSSASLPKKRLHSPKGGVAVAAAAPKVSSTPSASAATTPAASRLASQRYLDSPSKKRPRVEKHQSGSRDSVVEKSVPIPAFSSGKPKPQPRWDQSKHLVAPEKASGFAVTPSTTVRLDGGKAMSRHPLPYQLESRRELCRVDGADKPTPVLSLENPKKRPRAEQSASIPSLDSSKSANSQFHSGKPGELWCRTDSQQRGSNGAARSTAVETTAPLLPLERPRKEPSDARPLPGHKMQPDGVKSEPSLRDNSKMRDAKPTGVLSVKTTTRSQPTTALRSESATTRSRDNQPTPATTASQEKSPSRDQRGNNNKIGAVSSERVITWSRDNQPTTATTASQKLPSRDSQRGNSNKIRAKSSEAAANTANGTGSKVVGNSKPETALKPQSKKKEKQVRIDFTKIVILLATDNASRTCGFQTQRESWSDISNQFQRLCPSVKTFETVTAGPRRRFFVKLRYVQICWYTCSVMVQRTNGDSCRKRHAEFNETYHSVLQSWIERRAAGSKSK